MAVSRSGKSTTPSPKDGNSLSLFVDGADSTLKVKDIYGNVEDVNDYITGGGTKGQKGEAGATGPTGPDGAKGDTGSGTKGQKGEAGSAGAKGQKGETGVYVASRSFS